MTTTKIRFEIPPELDEIFTDKNRAVWHDIFNSEPTDFHRTKQEQIANCGKYWRGAIDPKTGKANFYQSTCKYYRECPRCAKIKRDKFRAQLETRAYNSVVLNFDNDDDAKKRVRGVDKSKYVRIPKDDGTTVIVIERDELREGESVARVDVDELSQYAVVPEGKRMSGSLHSHSTTCEIDSEKPEQPFFEVLDFTSDDIQGPLPYDIDYRQFEVSFDSNADGAPKSFAELERAAQALAITRLDETPTDEYKLQYCVTVLEQAYKEICDTYKMSFNFLGKSQYTYDQSEINWYWLEKALKKRDGT